MQTYKPHYHRWLGAVVLGASMFVPHVVVADSLHPGAGRFSVSAATGVPFVGISEAAYGLTDDLSFGVIFGATPRVLGVGARPRMTVLEISRYRFTVVVPVLYYPETNSPGGAPWLLMRPVLALDARLSTDWRAFAGGGVIVASSIDNIEQTIEGSDKRQTPYGAGAESVTGFGVWNTLITGVSYDLWTDGTLFVEGGVVLSGVELAGDDWVGGPPFTFSIGMTIRL